MTEKIIKQAESLLTGQFGTQIRLQLKKQFDGHRSLVLRCTVADPGNGVPESVIVKQTTLESDNAEDLFLNEWASLRFLNENTDSCCPTLYGEDRNAGLVVIEDMGDQATLSQTLFRDDGTVDPEVLVGFGRFLGEMQASLAGREEAILELHPRFGRTSVQADASQDVRSHMDVVEDSLAELEITPATGFLGRIKQIESAIHSPGPFRGFIHGDLGPHNVLYQNGVYHLIDFELASIAHMLVDAVCARMAFPPDYRGRRSPPDIIQDMESAYRNTLVSGIPEASDDAVFHEAISQTAIHWTVVRWYGVWYTYMKERLKEGESFDTTNGRTAEYTTYLRETTLTHFNACIATTESYNLYPEITDTFRNINEALLRLWPDLQSKGYFPAFE